jgi:hypothetical protein
MENSQLKIFIYDKNGKKIKEYFYSDFIYVFNEVLDHNIEYEEDEWNLINGFEFPPKGLLWDPNLSDWVENPNEPYILKKNRTANLIRFF